MKDNVQILCELAGVSRSGYYKWEKNASQPDKDHGDYLKIQKVFDAGKGKYGWRSIKMRLPAMNHKKIQRIMKKYGLVTKIRKKNKYRAIHKKGQEHRIFANKLQRSFHQQTPFKVFCTDITYLPFHDRFAYLSVVKDIASGEVMAWQVSLNINMQLVLETIQRIPKNICENTLIHSDQGFHYTNPSYIKVVKNLKMIQSMSRKGNCIDNAPIESFFGHMKDELEYQNCFSFNELYLKIKTYMTYYNHKRKQWNRNQMTPVEYRNYLLSKIEG